MKLEHFGMAEPGDCRLVFTASAGELAAALAKEQAAPDAPQDEEELLTAAVNRTILEGFDPLYRQLVQEQQLVPVTDPDFELLAVNKAEGFRADDGQIWHPAFGGRTPALCSPSSPIRCAG